MYFLNYVFDFAIMSCGYKIMHKFRDTGKLSYFQNINTFNLQIYLLPK